MTLDIFFGLCKSWVQASDKVNTWAVLEAISDLRASSLGKTIHDATKPYFFSREWAEVEYNPSEIPYSFPLLFAYEPANSIRRNLRQNEDATYALELICVEQYLEDQLDTQLKTRNEMFRDTENVIKSLLNQLLRVVYITGSTLPDGYYFYDHLQVLGVAYDEDTARTSSWYSKFLTKNQPIASLQRWSGSALNLYGTMARIQIWAECQPDTVTLDFGLDYDSKIPDTHERYPDI